MESHLVRGFRWGDQEFRFELCHRREVLLGPATIDQWWMPVPPLYGQRRDATPPHNHREILRLYWATVEHFESTQSQKAQECYLLASLVPLVRAEGSRTIFADAFLKPALPRQTQEVVQTLEGQLQAGCESQLTRAEFHTKSWDALGRRDYPEGVRQIYERYTRELLEPPCRLVAAGEREPALQLAARTWNGWMKSISRRAGHAQEKMALDILSYEARAAFHQCYSLVWCRLIPLLGGLEKFDEPTWIFLKFWHTDWIDTETQTSLFHGHVFGLHPGMGPFMLSETGRRLVGTWVADPDEVAGLHRLLHGILIALFDYAGRRDQAAADRPRRAASEGPGSRP